MLLVIAMAGYGVLCFYAFKAVRFLSLKGWDMLLSPVRPRESFKESFRHSWLQTGCIFGSLLVCEALIFGWIAVALAPPGFLGKTGRIVCSYIALAGAVPSFGALVWYTFRGTGLLIRDAVNAIRRSVREIRGSHAQKA